MTDTTTNNEQAPGPTLSVTDIQNAIRVIDYAAEQGAFRGWNTIEQVLFVRNRMNDFVRSVMPQEAEKAPEAPTTGEGTPTA